MLDRGRRLLGRAELWVPLAYALLTLRYSRPLRAFESSPDEGFNLVKAALVADGRRLYTEVWSDQPPLFTLLLRAIFAVFGESVLAGRLLVLGLACALLWAVARTARGAFGAGAAWAAPLLLLAVPGFQPLTVALLIGLPALSFTMLALVAAAQAHPRGSVGWAGASGVLLALGALTKAFVLPLAPVLLLTTAAGAPRGARGRCALAWLAGACAVLLVGGLTLVGEAGLQQLVAPHRDAVQAAAYRADPRVSLLAHVGPLSWLLALAAAGGVWAWRRRPGVLPAALAAWTLTALTVLALHRPVWHHHMPLCGVRSRTRPSTGFGRWCGSGSAVA
jgi:4-amino-4-deoxy-L-arabinose transferase-like glycosyltransferase